MEDIIFDKEYTYTYRDKYNEQCDCEQCILFRNQFPNEYKEVVQYVSQYGVNVNFPIEIMDIGIDNKTLKRKYMVYYVVKGQLPKERISISLGDVDVTMRNDIVSDEAYANTDMPAPFFVIELSNILLYDNGTIFKDAIDTGREIEFSYNGQHFFVSRTSDTDWYIYCEETKESQRFLSAQELVEDAILQGENITELWGKISLDCIL